MLQKYKKSKKRKEKQQKKSTFRSNHVPKFEQNTFVLAEKVNYSVSKKVLFQIESVLFFVQSV